MVICSVCALSCPTVMESNRRVTEKNCRMTDIVFYKITNYTNYTNHWHLNLCSREGKSQSLSQEEALGLDGSLAAGAGSGDGLSVDGIGTVASNEYARELGAGGAVDLAEIAYLVGV